MDETLNILRLSCADLVQAIIDTERNNKNADDLRLRLRYADVMLKTYIEVSAITPTDTTRLNRIDSYIGYLLGTYLRSASSTSVSISAMLQDEYYIPEYITGGYELIVKNSTSGRVEKTPLAQYATIEYVDGALASGAVYFAGFSGDGSEASPYFIPNPVADQTGNAGKYLTTDGTNTSWSAIPTSTGVNGLNGTTNIGLGGTLSSNTLISLNNQNVTFAVGDAMSPHVFGLYVINDGLNNYKSILSALDSTQTIGGEFYTDFTGTTIMSSSDSSGTKSIEIQPGASSDMVVTDSNSKGFVYASNYSAKFVARSLIDKGYADGRYALLSTPVIGGAINGLNKVGSNVLLGGSLTQNTTISTGASWYLIINSNDGGGNTVQEQFLPTGWSLSNTSSSNGSSQLGANTASVILTATDLSSNSTIFSVSAIGTVGATYQDPRSRPMNYFADYSANFTARSIIDKGYADAHYASAGSGVYTNGTGILLSGNSFSLDTTYTNGLYPQLTSSYANPAWIASLAYSKLSGAPTNVSSFTNDAAYLSAVNTDATLTGSGTSASALGINLNNANTWIAAQTIQTTATQFSLNYDGTHKTTFATSLTGNLTITPSGGQVNMVGATFNSLVTASSGVANGNQITSTLTAAANNDSLVALNINPTFTLGAFTGVSKVAIKHTGDIIPSANTVYNIGSSSNQYNVGYFGSAIMSTLYTSIIVGPSAGRIRISNNAFTATWAGLFDATGSFVLQSGNANPVDGGYRFQVYNSGTNGYFKAGSLSVNANGIPVLGSAIYTTTTTALATGATITAAQMAGGTITTNSTAAISLTTDTATNLGTQLGAIRGTSCELTIDNSTSTSSGIVTLTLGSGFSIPGTTVVSGGNILTVQPGQPGIWLIYFTSPTTAIISRLV